MESTDSPAQPALSSPTPAAPDSVAAAVSSDPTTMPAHSPSNDAPVPTASPVAAPQPTGNDSVAPSEGEQAQRSAPEVTSAAPAAAPGGSASAATDGGSLDPSDAAATQVDTPPSSSSLPSETDAISALNEMLEELGLEAVKQLSLKNVIKKLDRRLSCGSLKPYKAAVKAATVAFIGKGMGVTVPDMTDEQEQEAEPPAKKRRKTVFSKPWMIKAPLAEFLGVDELPRKDVVSRMWQYIRENGLQDEKDRRKIHFDDKLQAVFKRKTTDIMKINRLISDNLYQKHEG